VELDGAEEDGLDMMAGILDESADAGDAPGLVADDVVDGAPMPAMPAAAMSARSGQSAKIASDTVRAEYVKPLMLMIGGGAVITITMMGFGASMSGGGAGDAAAGAAGGAIVAVSLLIQLAIGSVLGAAIFWVAAKTWLGDLGPAHLILLRVAGIDTAVLAVLMVASAAGLAGGGVGVVCFGLFLALACAVGLTMWLFDLGFLQVVLLTIFCVAVLVGLEFALSAIGLTA
jgi:hypothetical protein